MVSSQKEAYANRSNAFQRIVRNLLAFLERNGVRYVALGNVASVLAGNEGDIDIAVDRQAARVMLTLLRDFCRESGGRLVQAIQHEPTAWYFVLAFRLRDSVIFIKLDVCSDYFANGVRLLTATEMIRDGGCLNSGVRVPSPPRAFIYYFLKKLIKGSIETDHFGYLRSVWLKDSAGARNELQRFFGSDDTRMVGIEIESGNFNALSAMVPRLHAQLRLRRRISVFGVFREWRRFWRRVRFPTGVWIAISGDDTRLNIEVARALQGKLAGAFRRTHLEPDDSVCSFGHARSSCMNKSGWNSLGELTLRLRPFASTFIEARRGASRRVDLVRSTLILSCVRAGSTQVAAVSRKRSRKPKDSLCRDTWRHRPHIVVHIEAGSFSVTGINCSWRQAQSPRCSDDYGVDGQKMTSVPVPAPEGFNQIPVSALDAILGLLECRVLSRDA